LILSLSNQANLFLMTVAAGFVSGVFYDIFRIIRLVVKHKRIFVHIEDGIYWLTVIFLVFIFMLNKNYGEIRPFAVGGIFLGMIIYSFLVSPLVMGISHIIINIVKYIIKLLITIILTPLRLIYMILGKPLIKLIKKVIKFIKKRLHLCKVYARIKISQGIKKIRIIIKRK